ncbi:MAG: PIN domain-containing protein [Planctomycetaceae bacterium]|nr:PIN domain-containing protein [Planctomycetota bacterium]NUN53698.1 PIN domain-containing protein [Planctomycetaceae bacterium]
MAGRTFVDTNVLLYMFDAGDPVRRARAREVMAALPEEEVVLSLQVLQEFYWNATRKMRPPLGKAEAAGIVRDLSRHEVLSPEPDLVLAAAAREGADGIPFWDALVVEAALAAGCTRLLTEDLQHGRSFDGLVVENPFRRK